MAYNDRIEVNSGDVGYQQKAQAGRTEFTPGKASSKPLDENWPKENRIPTGTLAFDGESAGPVEMNRNRVTKLGRGIVCDQTLPTPTVTDIRVEVRTEEGIAGANTTIETALPTRPAEIEKTAGNDNILGA
jgi:hypothetical protein